ncbi:hypothetical protein [Streptomyces sp. NPDC048659]|uniref:hypothetical protein n=1 Tax=Streptomyces sp. NPDC048659 TaxID=3155489 RepID=UPI003438D06C
MALFAGTEDEIASQRDVEGWDLVSRVALVVDVEQGRMRPVTDYGDFSRLERAHKIVSVIPSRGHKAYWRDFQSGNPLTEEIMGWIVTEQGDVFPFSADGATAEGADEILPPVV